MQHDSDQITAILARLDSTPERRRVDESLYDGIYIYGAGELGALALDYCEACGIKVHGFLDRSRTSEVVSRFGNVYPVYHPEVMQYSGLCLERPVAVAVSTAPFTPIEEHLKLHGWTQILPFYALTQVARTGHPLANGWRLGTVTDEEKGSVLDIISRLADRTSLLHFDAFLAWHSDYIEIGLHNDPIQPNQRYALPQLLVTLNKRNRQLVDIGGHLAESTTRLHSENINFDHYIYFEPDSNTRAQLEHRLREFLPDGRFTVYSNVLGQKEERVRFQESFGYCSQVWVHGSQERWATNLDSFNLSPDFIKIHTEGSERTILEGAQATVLRSRPVIAYSVYHRREGFHSDIISPMKMFPNYNWYFRLHGYQGTGAFIYAIPSSSSDNLRK